MTLSVARNLDLPREIVAEKLAVLGMSGSGKSNAAVVLAEEMYEAGLPWVTIDGKGDWWGIRASANGKKDGLSIPVLGGLHGDIPLEPTAGKLIANLVVDKRLTCVLDVSEFDSRQHLFKFLADFAETLLRRNRLPLHVFAEEADDYIPQRTTEKGELPRCLGTWQRLVKRGRFRGVGSTLITQRSSAINKDALNMTDTLIVMRMTAPLDHKAIRPWITEHGISDELIDSLPSLEDGEAWVWSPQKLKIVKRVHFRRRRTYDSGATPFSLDAATDTARLADIDLDELKDRMAETVARAEADDPKRLRAQITGLERELRDLRKVQSAVTEKEVFVVPAEATDALVRFRDSLGDAAADLSSHAEQALTRVSGASERFASDMDAVIAMNKEPRQQSAPPIVSKPESVSAPSNESQPTPSRAPHPPSPSNVEGIHVGKAERKVLAALAQQGERDREDLCLLTGYRTTASTVGVALSALRRAGYIEPDRNVPTVAGLAWLGDYEELPTGPALLAYWQNHLGSNNYDRKVFDALYASYPHTKTKEELQDATGSTRTASTVGVSLSLLRRLRLAEKDGAGWRASERFMQAVLS